MAGADPRLATDAHRPRALRQRRDERGEEREVVLTADDLRIRSNGQRTGSPSAGIPFPGAVRPKCRVSQDAPGRRKRQS